MANDAALEAATSEPVTAPAPPVEFSTFLETIPAGSPWTLTGVPPASDLNSVYLVHPDPIRLQCYDQRCQGERNFSPRDATSRVGQLSKGPHSTNVFLTYVCKDCERYTKRFSLRISGIDRGRSTFTGEKYGEVPPFSIHVSARLRALLKPDQGLFNKALASEAAGLGLGAFIYYRRILENQKARIFDRVIAAAKKLGADQTTVEALVAAKAERQFTNSLDTLGSGPLKAIYLVGQNPLKLLYDEVSDTVHAGDDATCLTTATTVRQVLGHLADKLADALENHAGLEEAVKALAAKQAARAAQKDGRP